jgi:hypothetical protein
MDRWLFLMGVIVVCCILCPPFLGVWIGIGGSCFLAYIVYTVLGGITR